MKRSSVVSTGPWKSSRGRAASPGEPSLIEIACRLEEVEERVAALAPHTRLAAPYTQELREIRLQIAVLVARPETAAPAE